MPGIRSYGIPGHPTFGLRDYDFTLRGMAPPVWDTATGKALSPSFPHHGQVRIGVVSPDGRAVAFSPDGHFALTVSYDRNARLWEATTGKPVGARAGYT